MGQRLVITIHAFAEDIAKIYYHWSAYTGSAFSEAKDIIENVDWGNCKTKKELILRIIRHIEENGGGIDGGVGSKEYNYVNQYFEEKYKFVEHPDRNNGLIAISETGMNDIQLYSEGDLEIDFDEHIIHNSVLCFVGARDEFIEFYADIHGDEYDPTNAEYLNKSEDLCCEINHDLQTIEFCDLNDTISEIEDCPDCCEYKGTYYMLVN